MLQDIFNPTRVTAQVGGKEVIFECGRLANQAHGAVWMQCGGTVVLVTVCSQPLEFDKGFFPLTVEYSEKMYAAGRIPGSFFRREIGRPSERETLVSRLIDRPMRPLFDDELRNDVVVTCTVMSVDRDCSPEAAAMVGVSACLAVSNIPWGGPIGCLEVGYVDGQIVMNPNQAQKHASKLDLTVAATGAKVVMLSLIHI